MEFNTNGSRITDIIDIIQYRQTGWLLLLYKIIYFI